MSRYRLKFSKEGVIKYIGHLDVMRYFQKAIRRANLPIAYSEGFSPHQILSFAFPLSVGYTSQGEYFDMETTDSVNAEEIKTRLNSVMNEGIKILDVRELPEKAPNCMACVCAASYNVACKNKIVLPDDFIKSANDFLSQETIPVNKPKKKGGGFVPIDLKEHLYEYKVMDDNSIYIVVDAGSETNIKPTFVMECILNHLNIEIPENAFYVHRVDIYENASDESNVNLKSLI